MTKLLIEESVVRQALEALEVEHSAIYGAEKTTQAITALRAALNQEKVEPVAVVDANDDGYWADILPDRSVKVGQLLYTHPAPAAPEEI